MKRGSNYDLLRIISAVAVIMIHVDATWVRLAFNSIAEYSINIHEIPEAFMISIYYSISRFAVPCYVMLSGAFILSDKKNAGYKYFYSKSFVKIGIPTIVFGILYTLYRIPACFIEERNGITELLNLLNDILAGSPMYHMWYLRMLIGIYALTPVIIRFKESITEKMFYKVSFVFLILVSVGYWRTGIAQSFEFLGYYMIGFSIRRIFGNRNNTGKALVLILTGIILEICAAGFLYKQMIEGNDNLGRIVNPYAPLIVLASTCIFAGFTMLSIKMELKDIANITFYIYLIHAGVWGLIEKIFMITLGADILTRLNGGIWVPLFVVVVFGISYVLSKLYLWIWDKLDKKARITNYLLKIVRLQTD